MSPIIHSMKFKPLRMTLKPFHNLAGPSKTLNLISYLGTYNPATLRSLKFLICNIFSYLMFLLMTFPLPGLSFSVLIFAA